VPDMPHDQQVTHRYVVHYPAHEPRRKDPNYRDFEAYRRRTKSTAQCFMGLDRGDFGECAGELELHHAHIEFALLNSVDLKLLDRKYPGVGDPKVVGAWVESAENLMWLCARHHRGHGGVHSASASDWEAQKFVRNLIS